MCRCFDDDNAEYELLELFVKKGAGGWRPVIIVLHCFSRLFSVGNIYLLQEQMIFTTDEEGEWGQLQSLKELKLFLIIGKLR